MAEGPEGAVRAMYRALDDSDHDAVLASFDADVQGVDELSRAWLRGSDQIRSYIDGILEATSNVDSRLIDIHVTQIGDAAFVTGVLEQDYDLEGERQSVVAPTTFGLRRTDGLWRICLFHSVPIPD